VKSEGISQSRRKRRERECVCVCNNPWGEDGGVAYMKRTERDPRLLAMVQRE